MWVLDKKQGLNLDEVSALPGLEQYCSHRDPKVTWGFPP